MLDKQVHLYEEVWMERYDCVDPHVCMKGSTQTNA